MSIIPGPINFNLQMNLYLSEKQTMSFLSIQTIFLFMKLTMNKRWKALEKQGIKSFRKYVSLLHLSVPPRTGH